MVRREWSFVRNAARRCGVPERHRDDVAIEVFLRFQKHIGVITAPSVIRAWLRTTTLYVSHEYFDTRASRYEMLTPTERIRLEGLVASAEEGFMKKENLQILLDHVEMLEPKRRAVFRAYAVDGVPVAQIAAYLGIPKATAYNRLRLARRNLQAALQRERLLEESRQRVRGLVFLPFLLLLHGDVQRRLDDLLHELLSRLVQILSKGLLIGAMLLPAGATGDPASAFWTGPTMGG